MHSILIKLFYTLNSTVQYKYGGRKASRSHYSRPQSLEPRSRIVEIGENIGNSGQLQVLESHLPSFDHLVNFLRVVGCRIYHAYNAACVHFVRVMLSLYFSFYFVSFTHERRDRVGDVLTSRLKNLSFSCWISLCLLNLFMLATVRRFSVIWVNFLDLLLLTRELYDFSTLQIRSTSSRLSLLIVCSTSAQACTYPTIQVPIETLHFPFLVLVI